MRTFAIAALAGILVDAKRMGSQYKSISQSEDQRIRNIKARIATETSSNPQELYYDATIDHFTNHGAGSETYKMRYLVDDTYFDEENGPIIFYAGNEGDVWTFFDNSPIHAIHMVCNSCFLVDMSTQRSITVSAKHDSTYLLKFRYSSFVFRRSSLWNF